MKKYIVKVKEISYGSMLIEANSQEEAESLAEYKYQRGFTNWSEGDYDLEVSEIEKDRGDAR